MWTGPSPMIPSPNTNTYIAGVQGIYSLEVTNVVNGCKTLSTYTLNDSRNYPISISYLSIYTISCPNGTIVIAPIINLNNINVVYTWQYPMGAIVSGNTTPTLITNAQGNYTATVTNTISGCYLENKISVYSCVGLLNNSSFDSINIYPNPVENFMRINFFSGEKLNLSITNSLGQVVLSKFNFDSSQELDISEIPNGLLFLKLEIENQQKIFKFVK